MSERFAFKQFDLEFVDGQPAANVIENGAVVGLVQDYYCSVCARRHNGDSRDGEAPCVHKQALTFAVAIEDAEDADRDWRDYQDEQRAASRGVL